MHEIILKHTDNLFGRMLNPKPRMEQGYGPSCNVCEEAMSAHIDIRTTEQVVGGARSAGIFFPITYMSVASVMSWPAIDVDITASRASAASVCPNPALFQGRFLNEAEAFT